MPPSDSVVSRLRAMTPGAGFRSNPGDPYEANSEYPARGHRRHDRAGGQLRAAGPCSNRNQLGRPALRGVGREHHGTTSKPSRRSRTANGGNRAADSPGYEASLDYIDEPSRPPATIRSASRSATTATTSRRRRWNASHRIRRRYTYGDRLPGHVLLGRGRRHAPHADRRRPQPGRRPRLDQRLRSGRLRRLHGGKHRPDPARHLHLPDQGGQRRRGRGRRCHHLQPGQRRPGGRPPRPVRRHPGPAAGGNPRGQHQLRHRSRTRRAQRR